MENLTKIVKDENGKEFVACAYWGTEKCSKIHKNEGCATCPMIAVMLNQLHYYEECFAEDNK